MRDVDTVPKPQAGCCETVVHRAMAAAKKKEQKDASEALLVEVFDDLATRFILTCPEEEFSSFERLFFQIELAHWCGPARVLQARRGISARRRGGPGRIAAPAACLH